MVAAGTRRYFGRRVRYQAKWSIVKSFLQYDRGPPGPCEEPNWSTAQQLQSVRDGTYLLTNDPNFRPGVVGLEGQELQKVE